MSDMFEGIQYREIAMEFPHYRESMKYGEWKDIPAGTNSFATGTQLRTKPQQGYTLIIGTDPVVQYDSLASVLSAAGDTLSNGSNVIIKTFNQNKSVGFLVSARKIQFKTMGTRASVGTSGFTWTSLSNLSSVLEFKSPTKFRVRPDHFYRFTTINAQLDFDDVDNVTAHINNQIRTSDLEFKLSKVKYDG